MYLVILSKFFEDTTIFIAHNEQHRSKTTGSNKFYYWQEINWRNITLDR
jgi:hypothetical protein